MLNVGDQDVAGCYAFYFPDGLLQLRLFSLTLRKLL